MADTPWRRRIGTAPRTWVAVMAGAVGLAWVAAHPMPRPEWALGFSEGRTLLDADYEQAATAGTFAIHRRTA
jgi:hypothetical protein